MKKVIIQSFKIFLFMTILTGVIYPIFITLIGQIVFPNQANGSFIYKGEKIIGSSLIGQNFADSIYFHSRPSVIDYNPDPSGASNLSLSSALLKKQVNTRTSEFRTSNLLNDSITVPSEMIFASGSGVDPHISVEAAKLQVNRIVISRKFDKEKAGLLNNLIDSLKEYPQFGVLGNQVINVLNLNLKLDEASERCKTMR